jgi:hypothetical protein
VWGITAGRYHGIVAQPRPRQGGGMVPRRAGSSQPRGDNPDADVHMLATHCAGQRAEGEGRAGGTGGRWVGRGTGC